jgi:CopG family transcriptional regulator / antitoxin EndoAI
MRKGLTMHRRINITLPEETVRLLDRVSEKGDRSGLIDRAIKHYVERRGRTNLRRLLKEGYQRRSAADLAALEEWFPIEHDVWSEEKK